MENVIVLRTDDAMKLCMIFETSWFLRIKGFVHENIYFDKKTFISKYYGWNVC